MLPFVEPISGDHVRKPTQPGNTPASSPLLTEYVAAAADRPGAADDHNAT
jgi:hypothetical protein